MKFMLFLILSTQMLVSCSGNKKNLSEVDSVENIDDEIVLIEEDDFNNDAEEEVALIDEVDSEILADNSSSSTSSASTELSAELGEYITQKNDTLMIIAWKVYGDYSKWRDIYNLNKDQISSVTNLKTGAKLKYYYPESSFNWSPSGNPYLIQKRDTLGKISHKVYNTKRYWKDIYHNNKPLIRDPNMIFAGFTIYYQDLDRNTASE